MKNLLALIFLLLFLASMAGQTPLLEIEGGVKITEIDTNNTATTVLVRLPNGQLALRQVQTLMGTTSGPGPFYLGQDTLGGIVFYIYTDMDGLQHGLIVAKTEGFNRYQNAPETEVGADRSWDGAYDTNQMANSPAKDYITGNFGPEWYLPSIDELVLLWNNRFHVNKALHDGGHTLLRLTDSYWSSTEIDFYTARYIVNGSGNTSSGWKGISRPLRAIRAF